MSMEFVEKRAKELYVSNSGLSKAADQFGYGYPFLSYSVVFHNYYIPDNLDTLVNSTENDRRICSIKRGDVFLTRTSETTDELDEAIMSTPCDTSMPNHIIEPEDVFNDVIGMFRWWFVEEWETKVPALGKVFAKYHKEKYK